MVSWFRIWVLLVLLLLTQVFANEGGGECATGGEESEEGEYRWQKRLIGVTITTVLITLSICFELAKETIEEKTSAELHSVIEKLFQELTILGFLSVLTFLLVELGTAIGNPISSYIFDEAEILAELIEYLHMFLFVIMVVFIFEVLLLIQLGEREKRRWDGIEVLATQHQDRIFYNYQKAVKNVGGQDKCLWRFCPFINPTTRPEERMNYLAVREEFISPRDPTQPKLSPKFKFNVYLSYCMGDAIAKIVEISIRTWIILGLFFFFVAAVSFLPLNGFVIVYLVFGWILLIWMGILAVKLNTIKLSLVPRVNLAAGGSINEMSTLLSEEQFLPPKYLQLRLRRRSSFGRFFFGPPANKHQLLFTGNTKGPELILFSIRLIILLNAIYLSGLLVVFFLAPTWIYTTVCTILSVIPPVLLSIFYAPRVLRLWVIVSNIEMLKKQNYVNKVLRLEKTENTLRVLKIIQLMKYKSLVYEPSYEQLRSSVQFAKDLPMDKLQSLREVFEVFDIDGSNTIDAGELVEVFAMLGQPITEEEANRTIKYLDADNDGELSFEEFAGYFQQVFDVESQSTETTIKNMFSLFEKNEQGEVTSIVFAKTLMGLDSTLSHKDVQALIEEVDINGDGVISLSEFSVMVRNHLLGNKKHSRKRR